MTKDEIYEKLGYQKRKRVIYLLGGLIESGDLSIKPEHHRKLSTIGLKAIERLNPKKNLNYKLMLYCLC